MSSKVFITGATGNIGSQTIRTLIAAGVPTTAFVRNEQKAREMFAKEIESGKLSFAVGEYDNVEIFKAAIAGHSRLLLLIAHTIDRMGEIKGDLAKIAYDQGVQQIVDISSFTVNFCRRGIISDGHTSGEEALRKAARKSKRNLVILRPGYFLTNFANQNAPTIKTMNKFFGTGVPNDAKSLIDPRDIGDVAASVFMDPIEKHGNIVYDVHPEVQTNQQHAETFSKVLGRKIEYEQVSYEKLYNMILPKMGHMFAYEFATLGMESYSRATPQITLLTKKPFRTFEAWMEENKHCF